jgi:hypothetical protein
MPIQSLSDQATLDRLLEQAESLLEGHRAGDPVAIARMRESHPLEPGAAEERGLPDAQLVVAREYGLRSWPHLVRHLDLAGEARTLHEIDLRFQQLPDVRTKKLTLLEVLESEARAVLAAHREGRPAAALIIRSTRRNVPAWRQGRSRDETDAAILASELTLDETRRAIARWHGFVEWSAVESAERVVDPHFEAACDAIVLGDADALRELLERDPSLAHARSSFEHRATLLHHVAANGIEHHRQWQSPTNAVELAQMLLAAGADPNALCRSYGDSDDTMGLLLTSAHPAAAGVQADLVEALCRGGVKAGGPQNEGTPLWVAITAGHTPAAERLARCGAPLDNLVFAAVAGDLALVQGYFDDTGRLRPERSRSAERVGMRGAALDPRHLLEYALIYAAAHGRRQIVEFLLTKTPDLTVREPVWQSTALGAAEYFRRPEIVALLSEHA